MNQTRTKSAVKAALVLATVMVIISSRRVEAEQIISTIDPVNDPNNGTVVVTGAAVAITVGSTAINLSSIELVQTAGQTAGQSFAIYGSTGSGSTLAINRSDVEYSNFSQTYSLSTQLTTETVVTSFVLAANTTYYLAILGKNNGNGTYQDVTTDYTNSTASTVTASLVSTPAYNSTVVEGLTGTSATDLTYYSQNSSANNHTGYGQLLFTVNGSPMAVPEPTSLSLAGIAGLVGTTVALIRRRRARVSA